MIPVQDARAIVLLNKTTLTHVETKELAALIDLAVNRDLEFNNPMWEDQLAREMEAACSGPRPLG